MSRSLGSAFSTQELGRMQIIVSTGEGDRGREEVERIYRERERERVREFLGSTNCQQEIAPVH